MADKQTPSRPPRGPRADNRPAGRSGGSQGDTRTGAPKGGSRPAGAKSGAPRAAGGKPGGFKSEGGFKAGGSREGGFKSRGEGFKGKSAASAGTGAKTGEGRPPRARTARPILQVPKAPALAPRLEPVEAPAG